MQDSLPALPFQVGKYEVQAEVGAGGLGRVFRAVVSDSGQVVAMKFLHTKFFNNQRILGSFHKELLIISRFHHRHIVSYLDSYFKPPHCYIVTEFIDGWSGKDLLKQLPRFPPLVALAMIFDVLRGIDYLHLHDTVHSDLSTANFLVEKSGRVLITDFGLSCMHEFEDYQNRMLGTPGYYSPEHISNASIGPKSDIYCAGLILYELLTGAKAVKPDKDRKATQARMRTINFDAIQFSDARLRRDVVSILKKCLRYSPMFRPSSADKVMMLCYKILKRYDVRYSSHAICQFLQDARLLSPQTKIRQQNIYAGL